MVLIYWSFGLSVDAVIVATKCAGTGASTVCRTRSVSFSGCEVFCLCREAGQVDMLQLNMAILMSNSMPMKLSGTSALVTLLQRQNIRTLFCSTPRFEKKKEPSKKYSSTLLLPKTSFPMKVEGKKRIARDKEISEKCKFASQYSWQRENRYIWFIQKKNKNNYSFRTGSEYILHDGPPYANGSPHLGHAVNKILKDITGRWVGNKKSKNMLLILLKVSQCSWSTAPLGARFT